jgi:DNA-binding response OmpR family regulator
VKARVLLVDDDEHILRSLSSVLARAGFSVTTSFDAAPAMAMTDEFDIVIADYNMKSATGAEVVRHFKARHASVFCIVLSGEEDDATRDRCAAAGADVILSKPVPLGTLRKLLLDAAQTMRDVA